ncbi:MAG: tRNA (adenosine(37)-N6)-threonylcarbamoyltransferase complex dimerization subunit type 1 TsaB [Gemmatimonadota bacterium]
MNWLAIDTATSRASVALGSSSADAREESLLGARQHAKSLIPMVERLLTAAGLTLDDVAGLVVADGPGSFTGLRVGAAFAKGLADTRGTALRIAPSLAARAMTVAEPGTRVLAVTDALRGDVYVAGYRFTGATLETVITPRVMKGDDLVVIANGFDRVVGDVAPAHASELGDRYRGDPPPDARALLDLRQLDGGTLAITDVHAWEPVYGRPAEAQAKWELDHGRALPGAAGAGG